MSNNREIFIAPEHNKTFNENGFVIFKNQFSEHQFEETFNFLKAHSSIETEMTKGWQNSLVTVPYYSTFLENNTESKKIVLDALTHFFSSFINTHLRQYKIIQANIFNKPINTGFVCPHQNLTTVDESVYTSLSIWMPLQDTDITNGALCLTNKSHKKFEKYRNTNISWAPLKASNKIEDFQMTPLEMKKGDVVVFDDSIIHGSPDNKSNANRLVFHSIAIPNEAKVIYCKKHNDNIDIISVPDFFWQYFTPGNNEPESPIIKSEQFFEKVYTIESIKQEIEGTKKLYD